MVVVLPVGVVGGGRVVAVELQLFCCSVVVGGVDGVTKNKVHRVRAVAY